MNKKIIRLIILKYYLIYQSVDQESSLKYDLMRNCLNHYVDDSDLDNIDIYHNNLSRRRIMKELRSLFMSGILDSDTYSISIDFLGELFDHYNEECIKERIY